MEQKKKPNHLTIKCIPPPLKNPNHPRIFKNKPYSHKADIWALGCVLYEMVTLKHAFDGSSINQLASKIIKGRFPPISSRYSTHLKDLINAMLQVSATRRPSIEKILTLPFIKRHIQDFISDIVTRPSGGIGAGTKMVKVRPIITLFTLASVASLLS